MYQPPAFRDDHTQAQHALIRRHPLGLLITAGPAGLMANPLPFLIDDAHGPRGMLRAHLARANQQWRELALVETCLVVFQGPEGYVSPGWYETKRETGKVVPTWNYTMVQASGRPRVIEDQDWLRRQVGALTGMHEQARVQPWAVEDAPEPFIAAQLRGIVGIEIAIERLEGKWKLSQNRPEADRIGVRDGLDREGPEGAALARLVAERGGLD